MEVKSYEAAFAAEIEELLQTPIFYDEQRSAQLYDQPEVLQTESLGARRALGSAAIRLIAMERSERRALALRFNPHLSVKAWNATQRLTPAYLKSVAAQRREDVRLLARQLALVNATEQTLSDEQYVAEVTAGLRGRQGDYVFDALRSVSIGPVKTAYIENRQKRTCFMRGVSIIAPTGYGKTLLMGRLAKALGVGKPLAGTRGNRENLRLLIIEPTQELVNQVAGEEGDRTFENASGLKPGRYFQYDHNTKADAVVITRNKFIDDFNNGRLGQEAFDLLFVDETHILTSPAFRKSVLANWSGMIFGFTATPQYNPSKDARHLLPHIIQHEELIDCIESGTLNGAQLFNVVLTLEKSDETASRSQADDQVITFLTPLLREGRRGIVFCEAGERSAHARYLAHKLSKVLLPHDQGYVRAKAIGSFSHKNSEVIKAYHAGHIDVLTTVRKGSAGLNGDFDFVFINRRASSMLEIKQIIGRGTRLSENFPYTVYAQLIQPTQYRQGFSVYEAFDLEEVIQGLAIGPLLQPRNPRIVRIEQFDDNMQALLASVNHKPVGEVFLFPNREIAIPDGYISLDELILDTAFTLVQAKRILDRTDIDWIGRREGRPSIRRYYEPEAKQYLLNYPLRSSSGTSLSGTSPDREPTKGDPTYVTIAAIGREYGIGWKQIHALVAQTDITITEKRYTHLSGLSVKREDVPRLKHQLEKLVPWPESGEATSRELVELFGLSDSSDMLFNLINRQRLRSRRKRGRDGRGTDTYYSPEDTIYLKAELTKRLQHPDAEPGSMSIRSLGAALEADPRMIAKKLTAEEKAQAQLRWIDNRKGVSMLLPTWTASEAQLIIDRLQRERVKYPDAEPGDVTAAQLATSIGIQAKALYKHLLPEHRKLTVVKQTRDKTGRIRPLPCWSNEDALQVAAHIKESIAARKHTQGK